MINLKYAIKTTLIFLAQLIYPSIVSLLVQYVVQLHWYLGKQLLYFTMFPVLLMITIDINVIIACWSVIRSLPPIAIVMDKVHRLYEREQ